MDIAARIDVLGRLPGKYKVVIARPNDVVLDQRLMKDSAANSIRRKTKDYLNPWTPKNGDGAFRYNPKSSGLWSSWLGSLMLRVDIVITNCPPQHYRESTGTIHAGCRQLAKEIRLKKPRLCVFGNVLDGHGQETILLDASQTAYENVATGSAGWRDVLSLATSAAVGGAASFLSQTDSRITVSVNAALVGGPENELRKDPIVVDM